MGTRVRSQAALHLPNAVCIGKTGNNWFSGVCPIDTAEPCAMAGGSSWLPTGRNPLHLLRRFGSPIKSMVQRRAAAASAEKGGAAGGPPASPLGRPAGGAAAQSGAAQCDAAAVTAADAAATEAGVGRQPEVDEAGQLAASPPSRRIISRPDIMVPPGCPPFRHRHHEHCSSLSLTAFDSHSLESAIGSVKLGQDSAHLLQGPQLACAGAHHGRRRDSHGGGRRPAGAGHRGPGAAAGRRQGGRARAAGRRQR